MALTYFNLDKNYLINHYRFKPIRNGFLLTNDFGSWVYLTKEEFDLLRHNAVEQNQALLSLLKDKGFLITNDNFDKIVNDFRHRIRSLFRGTYHHLINLDNPNLSKEKISENVKKIVDFILQTLSRELIIEFKGNISENFVVVRQFIDYFKEKGTKRVFYKIEADLINFNDEILDFLIDNKFDIWFPIKNINFSDDVHNTINDIQRRLGINFYLDVTKEILGQEQTIIDFFVENNFKSFFLRKTSDISKEEFVNFYKNVLDSAFAINKKNKKIVFYEGFSSVLLRKILDIHDTFYPELNSLCAGAVISELAYALDGNIYANGESIGMDIFNIGNVDSTYSSIVLSEDSLSLISSSINASPFLDKNVFFPYMGNCPVCNYKEGGNIITKYSNERVFILSKMLDYLFEKIIFDEDFLKFVQK